jgi:hypothetical protein
MSDDGVVVVIKVALVKGEERAHTWNLPPDAKALEAWSTLMATQLRNAYVSGNAKGFVLINPFTVYNSEHVISVSMQFLGATEFQQMLIKYLNEATRKMGFA